MTHLSPAEFVDYLDGTLATTRGDHVAACERCRAQAAHLRETLQDARVEDFEPSPLFWDHFPARVRAALDADVPAAPAWRRPIAVLGWAVTVILLAVIAWRAPQPQSPAAPTTVAETGVQLAGDARADQQDEAWQLLSAAAEDMKLEDAHAVGMAVPATTVDTAVLELTPVERKELGRLLQDELKRSGI
jgi:hypothetical protein